MALIGRGAALAVLFGSFASSSGCATERPYVWAAEMGPPAADAAALIQPRDTILVHVQDQPSMSGEFTVREDGGYLQPPLGNVVVARRSTGDVAAELHTRLLSMIVKPQVTVSIARPASARVNVVGEVKTPGIYELTRDRTVVSALAAAGWITDFASKDRVFVVRGGTADPRIRFRVTELTAPDTHTAEFRLHDGDVVVVE